MATDEADDTIPYFDVRLDFRSANSEPVVSLVRKIRPHAGEIKAKRLSEGGFVNTIWKVSVLGDADENLVVRINPSDGIIDHVDRELEYHVMRELSRRRLILPLYARFTNGLVYQFAPGECCLRFSTMNEPHVRTLLLRPMVALHALPPASLRMCDRAMQENFWCHLLVVTVHKVREGFQDEVFQQRFKEVYQSKAHLIQEAVKGRALMESLWRKYPAIVCHNDLYYTNIVYDKDSDRVHVIDWEMCMAGVLPLELAVLTEDWADEDITDPGQEDKWRREWVSAYLSARDGQVPSEDAVEQLHRDTTAAITAVRLAEAIDCLWMLETKSKRSEIEYLLDRGMRCFKKYKYYESNLASQ